MQVVQSDDNMRSGHLRFFGQDPTIRRSAGVKPLYVNVRKGNEIELKSPERRVSEYLRSLGIMQDLALDRA